MWKESDNFKDSRDLELMAGILDWRQSSKFLGRPHIDIAGISPAWNLGTGPGLGTISGTGMIRDWDR